MVLALVAASPLTAIGTGTIRGRVTIDHPTTEGGTARPNVADLGMREAHGTAADEQRSVIYLETAPRGAFEDRSDARVRMDQRNETFLPHVLAIMTGTTVEFTNSDRTYHNVFSLSKPKRFDLGRYAVGQSKAVRFDQPGVVRVFCEIHSHMNAFILVFDHRFFAVTDDNGRFRVDRAPPPAPASSTSREKQSSPVWSTCTRIRGRSSAYTRRKCGSTSPTWPGV